MLLFCKNDVTVEAFITTNAQQRINNINGLTLQRRRTETGYYVPFSSPEIMSGNSNFHDSYSKLFMSSNKNENEYSVEIRLREEAESPFRKVRFLGFGALLVGALTSLAVSTARIAAALAGVNTDLMEESVTNAVIDTAGVIVLGFLLKRDGDAQESRLKRAAKGAEFAKLAVRGSSSLLEGAAAGTSSGSVSAGKSTTSVALSALRRGRGVDKRVVIAAGGKDKISDVLKEAKALGDDALSVNDLVIVPVVLPQCTAPLGLDDVTLIEQENVLLPAGGNWRSIIADEAEDAKKQGVDVEKEGFCIVLKKNGRVGQRTRGIFLDRMCGEVTERREAGMDVKNI